MGSAVSTPSSVSGSYFRRKSGRSKRGKSKIVGKADMYQRAFESEGYLHDGISQNTGKLLGQRDDILMEIEDDICPEDAVDAVSYIAVL